MKEPDEEEIGDGTDFIPIVDKDSDNDWFQFERE